MCIRVYEEGAYTSICVCVIERERERERESERVRGGERERVGGNVGSRGWQSENYCFGKVVQQVIYQLSKFPD